ncbi:MAG: helix-turn-helix transcriptional regulator [Akkermansia sp.]
MQEKDSRKAVFVSRFLELLKSNSLTQNELSKTVKISQATISAYSLGKTTPKSDELFRIASCFGVTMDYLWGASDDNPNDVSIPSPTDSDWKKRAQAAEKKLNQLKGLMNGLGSDVESLGTTVSKLTNFITE